MRGSLREKAPGRWELRVPLPPDPVTGRRRRRSASFEGTKRQAERELARLVAGADDDRSAAQNHTLEHLLGKWWEQKEPRLSPTTAREYHRIIVKRLVPTMGTRKVTSIAPADLDTYYLRLAKDGLAPASIRQVHAVLSGALGQAVKWRWITMNPARDATLPKASRTPIDPPTPEQARRLLSLADKHSAEIGLFVRLSAAMGCRRAEVCGLRWIDIDQSRRTVKIRRSVVDVAGRVIIKDTKTHAQRVIALDPGTMNRLAAHHEFAADRAAACGTELAEDSFVLSHTVDGSKPLRPEHATNVFRTLRVKVGVPNARLHDLRHFVATQLISSGHDIRTVSGRLGHAKTSTTLDIYAAFLEPNDRHAADALGELLSDDYDI